MAEKLPRLIQGVDIRKFKLDAMDGFLLTRIDGKLDPKGLARETGLPDFSVTRALEKLEKLGIIEIFDPTAPPPAAPAAPPPEKRSAIAQFDGALLAPKYDPKELEEACDLTPEQKKRILDFYYRLDDLDHYTLLGVTRDNDKKAIKRSYFELASAFHPDRFFKKQLGTFKVKMEALFNRITEAHDTLVDRDKRAEYDAYIAEIATTRGMEAMLERALAESAKIAAAEPVITTTPEPGLSRPHADVGIPAVSSGASADEVRARKEALARRLMAGRKVSAPPGAQAPQPSEKPSPLKYANTADAMDVLKRRYEERIDSATIAQAQRYVKAADEALAKNDLVQAATSLNLASKFAPADAALAERAQQVKAQADATLCESYLKQAQYEERQGHFTEAARSWVKVAKIQNDAHSHERAANAIYRSAEPDLHQAADHAKAAIALEPHNVQCHVTLVEVYLKAGLTTSARRAADAAQAVDPKHALVVALLKKMAKG
jgi:curved DNA-binding protein CbpA